MANVRAMKQGGNMRSTSNVQSLGLSYKKMVPIIHLWAGSRKFQHRAPEIGAATDSERWKETWESADKARMLDLSREWELFSFYLWGGNNWESIHVVYVFACDISSIGSAEQLHGQIYDTVNA